METASRFCPFCLEKITKLSNWEIHWYKSKLEGGSDNQDDLCLLHLKCCNRGKNLRFCVCHTGRAIRPGSEII